MQINVAVDRLLTCFDCDSQGRHTIFLPSSVSHDDMPNDKISVDQCSLHGCANVSLW